MLLDNLLDISTSQNNKHHSSNKKKIYSKNKDKLDESISSNNHKNEKINISKRIKDEEKESIENKKDDKKKIINNSIVGLNGQIIDKFYFLQEFKIPFNDENLSKLKSNINVTVESNDKFELIIMKSTFKNYYEQRNIKDKSYNQEQVKHFKCYYQILYNAVQEFLCVDKIDKFSSKNFSHLLIDKRKRNQTNSNCPHFGEKHYAKGMCTNCYHKGGRDKKPWLCDHTDKFHYARGFCQNCYSMKFFKKNRKDRSNSVNGNDFLNLIEDISIKLDDN